MLGAVIFLHLFKISEGIAIFTLPRIREVAWAAGARVSMTIGRGCPENPFSNRRKRQEADIGSGLSLFWETIGCSAATAGEALVVLELSFVDSEAVCDRLSSSFSDSELMVGRVDS